MDHELTPYLSRTGTKVQLNFARDNGWGIMVSAKGVLRTEGFKKKVGDNGAWWASENKKPFDVPAFERLLDVLGPELDWIVLPDIVRGGPASLALSLEWLPRLRDRFPLMLAMQDGFEPADVEHLIGPRVGVFVGGGDEWKEETLPMWADLARSKGAKSHCARVNSNRRMELCEKAKIDGFDGSGASRYLLHLMRMTRGHRDIMVRRSQGKLDLQPA